MEQVKPEEKAKNVLVGTELNISLHANYLSTKEDLCPKVFHNKPQDLAIALEGCRALGAKTFGEAIMFLKNIYVINKSIVIWGTLPKALARKTGELTYFNQYFIDVEGKTICQKNNNLNADPDCHCIEIQRLEEGIVKYYLTRKDLEISGVTFDKDGRGNLIKTSYRNKRGVDKIVASETWKKYPKLHWKHRNIAHALQDVFSDIFQGIHIREYHDHLEDKKKVIEIKEDKKDIENLFEKIQNESIEKEKLLTEEIPEEEQKELSQSE